MVVEDDQGVLDLVASALRAGGYIALEAGCARDALTLSKDHPEPIDLLLTDLQLPDIHGLELARRVAASRPGIRCLFMSGYPVDPDPALGDKLIEKPFTREALMHVVEAALTTRDERGNTGSGSDRTDVGNG